MGDLYEFYERLKKSKHNIDYDDFVKLVCSVGYLFSRQKGSHQIFYNEEIAKINPMHANLSLQPRKGKAKPAQINEFIKRVEEYNLFS